MPKPTGWDHDDALHICRHLADKITPDEKACLNRVASSWVCDSDIMVAGDLSTARTIFIRLLGGPQR